ncbi:ABC transporter ATP-binding protein [Radiobacillus kanasensis]|uniref:ABC transporter ATP-binding protein n=1 Tax=Radiobacillus kanasensis TaxID=2844358 RepID=UPI001E648A62|nr:ABC transporter ATP-binding protein [Radiobacillus kanasensis]UFT99660.1 ABC transporter ATP-binding protein [Radiobacillus kanasensis]
MEALLKLQQVERSFGKGDREIKVLKGITADFPQHQVVALRGRSGSGKTTLLNLIGGLDQPSKGEIHFQGHLISSYSEKQRTEMRRSKMGIIFQSYGLVPMMTVEENVEFGLRIAGIDRMEWKKRVAEAIELVGLTKRKKHRPFELSGGEQQRVAVARAMALKPPLILADEPTAELDTRMAFHIIHAFQELLTHTDTTVIMTTHDPGILEIVDHVYTLEDGQFAEE